MLDPRTAQAIVAGAADFDRKLRRIARTLEPRPAPRPLTMADVPEALARLQAAVRGEAPGIHERMGPP